MSQSRHSHSISISTSRSLSAPSPPLSMSPKPAQMPNSSSTNASPTSSTNNSPRFPSSPSFKRSFSDTKKRVSDSAADEPATADFPSEKRQRIVIDSVSELDSATATAADADSGFADSSLRRDSAGHILCPHLSTISRSVLDFDLTPVCSVSLSSLNVYCCLVCGGFFSGRGRSTQAYQHSLSESHHVFINLSSRNIYCLPDDYQVFDSSLKDIQYNIMPRLNENEISRLHLTTSNGGFGPIRALDGNKYYPSLMGLNNISHKTDWFNVCIQALNRVPALKDFMLRRKNQISNNSLNSNSSSIPNSTSLMESFSSLICKLNNLQSFKSHVSPFELLELISNLSQRKFQLAKPSEPFIFLNWFLNYLLREISQNSKSATKEFNIISQCFQGKIRVVERKLRMPTAKKENDETTNSTTAASGNDADDDDMFGESNSSVSGDKPSVPALPLFDETVSVKPYYFLSLPLPPAPLFRDRSDKFIIPQIQLLDLLKSRYSREQKSYEINPNNERQLEIIEFPQYLIIHYQRFQMNQYFVEKNPTLIQFPLNGLDLTELLNHPNNNNNNNINNHTGTVDEEIIDEIQLSNLSIHELQSKLTKSGISSRGLLEKSELIEKLIQFRDGKKSNNTASAAASATATAASEPPIFDLIANVFHDHSAAVVHSAASAAGLNSSVSSRREENFGAGGWRIHLLHEATEKWVEIQDLQITAGDPVTMKQLVAVAESYFQIYQKRAANP